MGVLKSHASDSKKDHAENHTRFRSKVGVDHEEHSSGILYVCFRTVKGSVETVTKEGVDVTRYGRMGKGND